MADAIQVSKNTKDGGSKHAVGLGSLRVMIVSEAPNVWYAQGLEIDYIAQGTSLEAAQAAFEKGLTATISEVLTLFGDIQKLLKPAPPETWAEFFKQSDSGRFSFSQISTHELNKEFADRVFVATTKSKSKSKSKTRAARLGQPILPFDQISYLAESA